MIADSFILIVVFALQIITMQARISPGQWSCLSTRHQDNEIVSYFNDDISNFQAGEIVKKMQLGQVDHVSLSSCTISTESLANIIASVYSNTSHVSYLSIRHCQLDANVLSRLMASKTQQHCSSLELLDVGFNPNLDIRGVKLLTMIINHSSSLRTLVLDGNVLSPEAMRSIAHALRRHPSITTLSLSSCGLTDSCAEFIAFTIKSNKNITYLDLSCNQMTQAGLETIAAAIRSGAGRSIVSLDLSHNALGDLGPVTIAKAFEANNLPSLKHLSLREIQASPVAIETLLKAITDTNPLESLDLSGNPLIIPDAAPKKSKGTKKKMQELAAQIAPKLEQAVATGVQMFKELGEKVAGATSGSGKSLNKRRKLKQIGYSKESSKSKRAASGQQKSKGMGRSYVEREKVPVLAKAQKVEAKRTLKARRRALATLLSAVKRAKCLKVLGLVNVGLNVAASKMLEDVARSGNAHAGNFMEEIPRPLQVELELNDISQDAMLTVQNILCRRE